ncbi:MAG: leucine-rich repeat domain-containing protein [Ruminococcus sp.]|nr:leucine-rich repeat domain-containing protein [Ruminococcus sp.]
MQDFIFKPAGDGTYCVAGYTGDEAEVVIPESYGSGVITVIGDKLFSGHSEITLVKIPATITNIGEFVFDGCENLRKIDLPPTVECLWGYTFVRCGIEEIKLPDALVTVPPFAFKDCKNLKKVVCNKGLKKIYSWAFGGCDNLKEFVCEPTTQVSRQAFDTKELNT